MFFEGRKFLEFHLQETLLCHLKYLYVPSSECANMILEAHYNWVVGNFWVEKIVIVLQQYFIGQTFDKMLGSTLDPALPTPFPNI